MQVRVQAMDAHGCHKGYPCRSVLYFHTSISFYLYISFFLSFFLPSYLCKSILHTILFGVAETIHHDYSIHILEQESLIKSFIGIYIPLKQPCTLTLMVLG